ncbi:aldo/keto reductase [Prosthecobacter sp.]|uniref:aldo/keto reductase n=1 Tax=Prosthecobacter sp. TaxID=1965333 RepID=UPI002ABBDBBD|nr:aldo/keto reductase [Prosthecobacter sp.]MDZ4401610.1 aldo/keto reductase [Prosthecobacter sp.]
MNLTRTAYGTWSGGKFMHFGEMLDDERYIAMIRSAFEKGVRTFVTADVYGAGRADSMLGEALKGLPRDEYCLVGIVGHDFYTGLRAGSKGYPRFTDAGLHKPEQYGSYLTMAAEESLKRCGVAKFDCLMLHNPDTVGYTSEDVWNGLTALKNKGLTDRLGIAPGPANGFTLDMIDCFERFGDRMDWAMIILNPFEPWPGQHVLPAAKKNGVDILARVVDYGGLFHDDVKPGHKFRDGDHRAFRPAGWVEHGYEKIEKIRPIAEKHGLTMIQLACQWTLANAPVKSVVPTLIQEAGAEARSIESKLDELAALPAGNVLSAEEVETIRQIGDNTGCMALKGASQRHEGQEPRADEWPMRPDLLALASRWDLGTAW